MLKSNRQKTIRSKAFRVLLVTVLPVFLFFILHFLFPFKIKEDYSQVIELPDGTVVHAFLNKTDKWRLKAQSTEITPLLRKTILYKEDKYFYYHPGINPVAVIRAAINNLRKGKKTSGASTITMQLVRLLEPRNRTIINKIIETFRALQLEWQFSKDEILQLYLNLVPYGGNIEGVKAAAQIYFQQSPQQLSLAQITALAIIPNRPTSLVPGQNNTVLLKERNKWLKRLYQDKIVNKVDVTDAIYEPLNMQRHAMPQNMPHLALRLRADFPDQSNLKTHINFPRQHKIETLTYNYLKRLSNLGIHNAAVLVINNKTRKVEAYVGSGDFLDGNNHGQVDGVQAVRSPGSTLKPFLYALAFDRGLLTPKQKIADVPTDFAGYRPENFDKRFNGNITAEQALAYSLNIPAVKILEEVGVPVLTQKLKQAGFNQVSKDEKKLGLSTILGGCGVRLEELTNLFVTLASQGKWQPLLFSDQDKLQQPIQLLSPEAAFLSTEILTQLTRPDLPQHYQNTVRLPKIAWKTGTSYGRRDAWSIGYNQNITIGVWVGNFSGEGAPALTGTDIATPLLFDLFNALSYNADNNWFRPSKNIDFRLVCAESGKVPNEFCENQVMDYFIPAVSDNSKCDHLKPVLVSADEKTAYCRSCLPENGYKKSLYPNYKPELLAYFEAEGLPYQKLPQHNPGCNRIFDTNAPKIVSPAPEMEYLLDRKEQSRILLSCQADNEVKKVYWYINDVFYKAARPTERLFFRPEAGECKISCTDDKGRNSNIFCAITYF